MAALLQEPAQPELARDASQKLAGREVDATLWVPLSALRDEGAVSELLVELGGGSSRRFPSLTYGEYVIWGLTHRILTQFLDLVQAVGL